jgi:Gpi18-like mannosyltransferase
MKSARLAPPGAALVAGLVLLLIAAVWVRAAGWPDVSRDMAHFLFEWVDDLRRMGIPGLAQTNANYNPPYLYLLLGGLAVAPGAGAADLTKSISTIFDVALGAAVAWSLWPRDGAPGTSRWQRPAAGFALTLILPTVWMNSAVWGQCDAIYTFWLVLGFTFAQRRQDIPAALCLVSALAFKLQAAFLGPVVLALIWCTTGRLKFVAVLAIGYLIWLWPSVLAGRTWGDALTVYLRQATTEMDLSLGAPNLWTIANRLITSDDSRRLAVLAGLAATTVLALAAIPFCVRLLRQSRQHLLPLACTAAFLVPFLLPKMHERYFFPSDVLAVALALRDRRWVPIAVLIQVGSATACMAYLTDLPGNWLRPPGILADCVVAVLLLRYWLAEYRQLPNSYRPAETARAD